MSVQFEYFYGSQAEQFALYRIPKLLITSPEFKRISDSAKLLYGLMLDRTSLLRCCFNRHCQVILLRK